MRLFVANLDDSVMAENLEQLFMRYSPTLAQIWRDAKTAKSKGFGFVEIPDDWRAERAISELNGTEFYGKRLKVSKARPKSDQT